MEEQVKDQEQAEEKSDNPSYFGMGANELAAVVKGVLENKDAVKGVVKMFSPIVSEAVDLIMDTVGPEVYKVMLRTSLANVELRKEVFKAYKMGGTFTSDQAFYLLTMDTGSDKFGKIAEATKSAISK